ncbi:hypothetical protein MHY08_10560, partial [Corynebacterium sp. ACRPJ]
WKEPEYPAGNKPSTKWPWPTPTASTNTYKPSPTHKQLDTLHTIAWFNACSNKTSMRIESDSAHPRILGEYASVTKAVYTNPFLVRT